MSVRTQPQPQPPRLALQRWIAHVVGRRFWLVVGLCALQALMAVNGVAFALLMRGSIDAAVAGESALFWHAALAFAVLVVAQVALRAGNRSLSEYALVTVENTLRQHVLDGILSRRPSGANPYHSGELVSRMTSDVTVVATGVVTLAPSVVSMGVRLIGALGVMLVLMPRLALVLVGTGCVLALCSWALRGWVKRLHHAVQEAESRMRCLLQECVGNLLVVYSFGCEGKVVRSAAGHMDGYRHARMRKANASNACSTGLNLALQGGYVLAFVWCGWGILQGTVSYGTLMAAVQLVGQIQSPFASMGGTFSRYSAALASAERLMELRDTASQGFSREEGERAPRVESLCSGFAALCLEGVSFSYGQAPVLKGVTLRMSRGEAVALVGESGAGKSTLMRVLLGACAPASGAAFVQLEDGERYELAAIPAGLFAYVPQDNGLMSGTIREVVGLSEHAAQVDEERLHSACEVACAAEFIEQLEGGYETVLGERGAGLSGGQLQRLAVARAVYSGAPVLLLDEATSALDAQTERRMLERLRRLGERTVLIVTHRAEAQRVCDRVVRLEGGALR